MVVVAVALWEGFSTVPSLRIAFVAACPAGGEVSARDVLVLLRVEIVMFSL